MTPKNRAEQIWAICKMILPVLDCYDDAQTQCDVLATLVANWAMRFRTDQLEAVDHLADQARQIVIGRP